MRIHGGLTERSVSPHGTFTPRARGRVPADQGTGNKGPREQVFVGIHSQVQTGAAPAMDGGSAAIGGGRS